MFDFGTGSLQKWKIATVTARHTLMICRLDPQMKEEEIARFLVTRGIPFRTLQASTALLRTPLVPKIPIKTPCRPLSYQFTLQDYDAYTIHYRYFLLNPRSRAALMKGGYIWRVAIPVVSITTVISGPTGWSTDPEEMFIASSPELGKFVDDELTDAEIQLLCGLYHCSTGKYLFIYFLG